MPRPSASPAIDTSKIKNFPVNIPGAQVAKMGERLRVIVRRYVWNEETGKKEGKCDYLGYIVENEYFDTETYRRLFDRHGRRRATPLDARSAGANSASLGSFASQSDRSPTGLLKPALLETPLLAAEIPLYYAAAESTGLPEDLEAVWGKDVAAAILSLAFHRLSTSENAASRFESWAEERLLPHEGMEFEETIQLLKDLGSATGALDAFFRRRLARLADGEELVTYAQWGGAECGYQKRAGLVLLVGRESRLPVLFRKVPGQITDLSAAPEFLFHFDRLVQGRKVTAAAVPDAGEETERLARFIDAESPVVMPVGRDADWVRGAFEKARPHLRLSRARIPGRSLWGVTVPCELPEPSGYPLEGGSKRGIWLHVFLSEEKEALENSSFFAALDQFETDWQVWQPEAGAESGSCPLLKSPLMAFFKPGTGRPGETAPERNHAAIDEATRRFGCFCLASTMECDAAAALACSEAGEGVERTFTGGGAETDREALLTNADDVLQGRFFVGLVALSIFSEILRRMREPSRIPDETDESGREKRVRPLADEMDFDTLRSCLSAPRLAFDADGRRARWLKISFESREIVRRLGYSSLYEEVPAWART